VSLMVGQHRMSKVLEVDHLESFYCLPGGFVLAPASLTLKVNAAEEAGDRQQQTTTSS
jgi:hypothetical protein